ncbi:MAG: alpha-L-fucosidase [Bacteroidales bacterium]
MKTFKLISNTLFLASILLFGALANACSLNNKDKTRKTEVTESSADTDWFRDARFGMFVHWGLYSILGGSYNGHTLPDESLSHGKSWYSEWVQMRLEVPTKTYHDLAKQFNPVNFDADEWAREASLAGMKYLVLTSKHHDGFALWDSDVSNFDLGSSPCKRDLLGELATACRKYGLKLGFYYSHWQDWECEGGAQPDWEDKVQPSDAMFQKYWQKKSLPQVRELLERYKPDMLWFDTWSESCKEHITPKRRDELIDLIRSIKPDCLINGRICAYDPGPRVDYISAFDNEHPEKNLGRPWQTPATMYKSWAWHANDFNWKSSEQMIKLLVTNASLGGNYLLNIGPYANGKFPAPALRRLREIGAWLVANGESIYGTSPIDEIEAPSWGRLCKRANTRGTIIYAHVMDWENGTLAIPEKLGQAKSAMVLETGQKVELTQNGQAFIKPNGALDHNVATIKLIF